MITWIFIVACSALPSATVADTPTLAVRGALLTAEEHRNVALSESTFLGLPRPGPGIEFSAALLPSAAPDRVAVQLEVRAQGQLVSRRAYELPLTEAGTVIVPRHTIPAGRVITAEDLTERELKLGGPPGRFARQVADLVGKQARVTLLAMRPIPLPELRAEKVVERGEVLTVAVLSGGLEVTVLAEALEDGAVGARIKVKNQTSQRVFAAVVVGKKRAEVERP